MNNLIYCDNAATSRPFDEVIETMLTVLRDDYGNPSSLHRQGQRAKKLLENARLQVANLIQAKSNEIIFTSGGTESNNIAIKGLIEWAKAHTPNKKHLISCVTEHSSVYEIMCKLENDGYKASWLKVNEEGFIDLNELTALIDEQTLLVSIMHANNEIGTVQNIDAIGSLCQSKQVLFHTDAVQSAGKIPIDVRKSQIDLLSISGHKLNGPKGIGALFIGEGVSLQTITQGGSQEKGLSPGTENIAGAVGLGKAAELKLAKIESEMNRLRSMQKQLIDSVSLLPGVVLNGPKDLQRRIPGNVNISHEKIDGDKLVMQLNLRGICASSGSACAEGKIEASRVISSLYPLRPNLAHNSLRLSLGSFNQPEDIPQIIQALTEIIS